MWPRQVECDSFYGDPRGANGKASPQWELDNLIKIVPPFVMTYERKPIEHILVHKKCAGSLNRVLQAIWVGANKDQTVVNRSGASVYAGCYNFRNMRGRSRLSMHAYGCAIDLDPENNAMGDSTPRFAKFPWVVNAFKEEGWVWGGDWSFRHRDGMHFQAARVS